MRFEKWQALGNDYLIVEAADLPRALDAELVRRLCDRHAGPGADGVLELSPPQGPGCGGAPADLQPRRLGGRAVGQRRAPGGALPASRGLDRPGRFAVETLAGEIRPTILSPTTARIAMGRARLRSKDFPGGPGGRHGHDRRPRLPARVDRQPAVRDPRRRAGRARRARSRRARPGDRARSALPQPHQRVVLVRDGAGRHPRPDLRARRRGDAVVGHRGLRRRGRLCPARRPEPGERGARRRRAHRRHRRPSATSS